MVNIVLLVMFKRTFDILTACILLLFLSPLIIIISAIVLITSGRPILFSQKRLGLHLNTFTMYKFRTMVNNSEYTGSRLFSYENDSRITPVGKILRVISFDEIPQLLNVIKGDMSIVGPRPPVTYELGPISGFPDHLRTRFSVRPGITGLAQVIGRNDNNWDEKVRLDNKYITLFRRYGLAIDIFIILLTFYALLFSRNTVESPESISDNGPITTLARNSSNIS